MHCTRCWHRGFACVHRPDTLVMVTRAPRSCCLGFGTNVGPCAHGCVKRVVCACQSALLHCQLLQVRRDHARGRQGASLLRLTRCKSLLVTSTERCSVCLYGRHWMAIVPARQAADRHLNLQRCQPRAAHRPPAWVQWIWNLGPAMRAALCVFLLRCYTCEKCRDGADRS